jgi:hypothetical protein
MAKATAHSPEDHVHYITLVDVMNELEYVDDPTGKIELSGDVPC